jgi:acetyl esterase
MPVDPELAAFLKSGEEAQLPPLRALSAAEARWTYPPLLPERLPEVGTVLQVTLPTDPPRPARIYQPSKPARNRPGLLWLFGGGFVLGNLDSGESTCRYLCEQGGITVVALEYRLAPEFPFPAAVSDAAQALSWLRGSASQLGADPQRLVAAGYSSGASLANAACLWALERGEPLPRALALICPPAGEPRSPEGDSYPSRELFASGYGLSAEDMDWFGQQYLRDEADLADPYFSPMRSPHAGQLPRTLIYTAEYDPLRDEGERYARFLQEAGVQVISRRYQGAIHQFFVPEFHLGRQAHDDLLADLGSWLG